VKKLSVILLLTLSGQTQATLWGKLAGAARTGLSAVRSCQKNLFPKEPQPKNIENLLEKLIDPKFKTAPIVSAETQSLLAETITEELERTAISLRRDNFSKIILKNSYPKTFNANDCSLVLFRTRQVIEDRLIDDLAIKNIEPLLSEILKQQKKNNGCVFSYFWVNKFLYPPLPKQLAIGIFEETIKKATLPVFSNTALPIIEFEEGSKQKELARKYLEKYHSFLITHKDPQSIKAWGDDYYSGKSSLIIRDIANGIFPSPKKNETN
jgi:hypothetical protein